jgi:hypothetical protein
MYARKLDKANDYTDTRYISSQLLILSPRGRLRRYTPPLPSFAASAASDSIAAVTPCDACWLSPFCCVAADSPTIATASLLVCLVYLILLGEAFHRDQHN